MHLHQNTKKYQNMFPQPVFVGINLLCLQSFVSSANRYMSASLLLQTSVISLMNIINISGCLWLFPVYINFSCSLFVARYHLKYCALVYDCYSKVGLLCFKIFCIKCTARPKFLAGPHHKPSSQNSAYDVALLKIL